MLAIFCVKLLCQSVNWCKKLRWYYLVMGRVQNSSSSVSGLTLLWVQISPVHYFSNFFGFRFPGFLGLWNFTELVLDFWVQINSFRGRKVSKFWGQVFPGIEKFFRIGSHIFVYQTITNRYNPLFCATFIWISFFLTIGLFWVLPATQKHYYFFIALG